MKQFLLPLFFTAGLCACGSSYEEQNNSSLHGSSLSQINHSVTTVANDFFSIDVPDNWEIFSKEGPSMPAHVSVNKKEKTKSYELKLPTDELFAKVHGEIRLHYTVYSDKHIILLTNITPDGILDEGHRAELSTYKGVMISKANPEKDMFKINLLNMLQK